VSQLIGGLTGAVAGQGEQGVYIGAGAAGNAVANNRLLHYDEKERIRVAAAGDGAKEERLTRAACYVTQCWAQFPEGSELYRLNHVSAVEAATLTAELGWVAGEQRWGLFKYTAFDKTTDRIASITGLASGTLNGQAAASALGAPPYTGQDADRIAGVPYGRDGSQYGPPDYVSGQVGIFAFSAGGALNLKDGTVFGQWSVGRQYPGFTATPGISLTIGNVFGSSDAADVNSFLGGAGIQGSAFLPLPVLPIVGIGGGINHSYGGRTASEFGVSIPPGVAINPLSYGFK